MGAKKDKQQINTEIKWFLSIKSGHYSPKEPLVSRSGHYGSSTRSPSGELTVASSWWELPCPNMGQIPGGMRGILRFKLDLWWRGISWAPHLGLACSSKQTPLTAPSPLFDPPWIVTCCWSSYAQLRLPHSHLGFGWSYWQKVDQCRLRRCPLQFLPMKDQLVFDPSSSM